MWKIEFGLVYDLNIIIAWFECCTIDFENDFRRRRTDIGCDLNGERDDYGYRIAFWMGSEAG